MLVGYPGLRTGSSSLFAAVPCMLTLNMDPVSWKGGAELLAQAGAQAKGFPRPGEFVPWIYDGHCSEPGDALLDSSAPPKPTAEVCHHLSLTLPGPRQKEVSDPGDSGPETTCKELMRRETQKGNSLYNTCRAV